MELPDIEIQNLHEIIKIKKNPTLIIENIPKSELKDIFVSALFLLEIRVAENLIEHLAR